jgi:hypothetical protein
MMGQDTVEDEKLHTYGTYIYISSNHHTAQKTALGYETSVTKKT